MNSFFSALAGATGGLIGVISAFLISKILTREEKFLIIEEKIEFAIIKAEGYKQILNELDMEPFIQESRKEGENDLIKNFVKDCKKTISELASLYFSKYDDFEKVFTLIEKKRNSLLQKLEKTELKKFMEYLSSEINKIESSYTIPHFALLQDPEDIFEKHKIEIYEFIKINKFLSKKTKGYSHEKTQINILLIIISLFFIVTVKLQHIYWGYWDWTDLE